MPSHPKQSQQPNAFALRLVRHRRKFLAGLGGCLLVAGCIRTAVTPPVGEKTPAPAFAAAVVAKPAAGKWGEFHQTVQPVLTKYCYDCHTGVDAEKEFHLDIFRDEAALTANADALAKVLKNLSAHKMPPSDEPQPSEAEATAAVSWLRTRLAGDPTSPVNPGRVTMHRLNRAEYNNTIRDLLAIDIRPGDSFPVDDSGYGFDNNGDVLSIAPVLMEKYLAAAGLALEKAIHPEPIAPTPVQRWDATIVEGTIPKPGSAPTPAATPRAGGGLRVPMPMGRVFNYTGEIYTDYEIPTEGSYVLRARAYGTQGSESKQRPQVAFLVDGKTVREPFTIKEDQRNTSVYAVEKTHLTAGKHRISLAMLNGSTQEEAEIFARNAPPPPPPKTEAEIAAEEAAAIAAENAAEAAAVVAASAPAKDGAPAAPNAGARKGGARIGAKGVARGGAAGAGRGAGGPPAPPKPTLGVIFFELEGPLEPTPDRMPESYRRVMVAQPSAPVTKPQAAEKIIRTFATRAYRRPVTDDEVNPLMALWTKTDADGRPFDQSIDLALQAVLVSPAFLFRIEREPGAGEPAGVHVLNDYELATRLSYFLWSSMPDEELFTLAEKGKLRANLTAQVRRMLQSPKSSALVENFAGQWLQLRLMQNVTPDTKQFPEFDDALRAAMAKETELFFNAVVQEDRSVVDFIDADFSYLNERLAKHYGVAGVTGDEFRRVTLPREQRGGLLTQASILTITSYPSRTSPVQRGKWVLENLFDAAPPPPPPNVPALADGSHAELTGTLRQRMEQHRVNPNCAACHTRMDAIGFALENFDAIGAWRTQDSNHEKIDATGSLPGGKSFNGPAELRAVIKSQSDEFCRCLSSKMLTFALGRGLEVYDLRTTETITEAMKSHGNKFSALIEAIVQSDAFQKRNGIPKKGDS